MGDSRIKWAPKFTLDFSIPSACPAKDMLSFYAEHFDIVELNNSFYHLPASKSFRNWRETVEERFRFAVKGSRFITHMKKLKAPKTSTRKFFPHVGHLEQKLGPILFQLPPRWKCNIDRLAKFLQALPDEYRYTFEFRDQTWFRKEIYDLLEKHNAALCFYHQTGYDSPMQVTADFIYVRLHGTESKYSGSYPPATLEKWADRIKQWEVDSKDMFFFFNNDPEGHAVEECVEPEVPTS